jgi:hypothetical protein
MSDQNQDNEPAMPWFQAPIGRGVVNGVFLFFLLVGTQHFGLIEPGPPVTMENVQRFALFGLGMGFSMYFWTGRRIKRDRARREADRLARIRADAYDADQTGDADKDGSER